MLLHLLRHADAEDFVSSDANRKLTEKGLSQANRVGEFLLQTQPCIDLILTSPYLRALQTARAVTGKLYTSARHIPLVEDRRLICGLLPLTGLVILQEHQSVENVLLVGHQPDLSILAAYLLTSDGSLNIEFQKAALLTMTLPHLGPGCGILESHINVKQMALNPHV